MGEREPFKPLGEEARWKTVYAMLKTTKTGGIITYRQLGDALGLDPERDRVKIVQAVRRAGKEHQEKDKRSVEVVRGEGYRPVDASGSLALARGQQRKAGRTLARGHSAAVNVDLNGVEPTVRAALETLGKAFVMQMDFNRRFEGKQAEMEDALRSIADTQEQDRKRTDDELAELRERLARLEGGA